MIILNKRGFLLAEILLVTSFVAVILVLVGQMVFVSTHTNKVSGEKSAVQGLLEETLETARAVASEKWQNLYNPPDGSGDASSSKGASNHYYSAKSGNKWIFTTGSETVTVNQIIHTRYFYIENVSRDLTNKEIELVYNVSRNDPSTQKITVFVVWSGGSVSASEYLTRWRNKVCAQSNWQGGLSSGLKSCPVSTYESQDGNINDTVANNIKLKLL